MLEKLMIVVVVCLALVSTPMSSVQAQTANASTYLTTAKFQKEFVAGKKGLKWTSPRLQREMEISFNPDGSINFYLQGPGNDSGKWWFKEPDIVCWLTYRGSGKQRCRHIALTADGAAVLYYTDGRKNTDAEIFSR